MWAGDTVPGLGALKKTQKARPEGPQALQVPRGRRDLCVCVCVCVCVCEGGAGGRAAHSLLWLWWVRRIEFVPRGLGRPGLGAGEPRELQGE